MRILNICLTTENIRKKCTVIYDTNYNNKNVIVKICVNYGKNGCMVV